MSEGVVYEFDWDAAKALSNARKHGVTFDEATTVFLDALALTVYDAVSSQGEDRWFTLGFNSNGTLLAVSHTHQFVSPTGARIRIISARRATRAERKSYEDEPR